MGWRLPNMIPNSFSPLVDDEVMDEEFSYEEPGDQFGQKDLPERD